MTISTLDSHEAAPPMLDVLANGATVASVQTEKGRGLPDSLWESEGKSAEYTVELPAMGSGRVIAIRSVTGSWIALDSVNIRPMPEAWEVWRHIPQYWAKWILAVSLMALALYILPVAGRELQKSPIIKKAFFGVAMALSTLALAEGMAAIFFHYTKDRFSFYDFSSYLLDGKTATRLAKSYDRQLGWRPLYQTPFGERPRPVEYPTGFMATFGDSFTHCDQVDDDETWETYLAARLNKNVYNFGVGGYGTDQAYLAFKRHWPKVKTKVAALCLVPENISRVANVYRKFYYPATKGAMAKPRFIMEDGKLKLIPNPVENAGEIKKLGDPAFLEKIGRNDFWYIYNQRDYPVFGFPYLKIFLNKRFWLEVYYLKGNKQIDDMIARPAHLQDIWRSREVDVLFGIFDAFVADARAMGVEPVIAVLPTKDEAEYYWAEKRGSFPVEKITAYCGEKGYRVFNGVEGMARNARNQDDIDSYFIGHASPLGNRLVAEAFYEYLKNAGLVTPG